MKNISKLRAIILNVIIFILVVAHSYLQGRISDAPIGIILTIGLAVICGIFMLRIATKISNDKKD